MIKRLTKGGERVAVFGIVSEFNPFHKGHEYLVSEARRLGASAVVAVMSGNATQRGELAICDKYSRAEAAVKCGADLVLELPFPFSASSAEIFAKGGISVLSHFCDTVIFGSECGDVDLLSQAAEFASSEEFRTLYREKLTAGEQSAAAYIELIKERTGRELSSNDILGVEYIKAAKKIAPSLKFVTLKRQGGEYRDEKMTADGTPDSAMAIRKTLRKGRLDELSARLPKATLEVLTRAINNGEVIDEDKYFEAARLFFRVTSPESLANTPCLEGGIAERICRVAHESASGEEFFASLSTKRYTDAKLRRGILFALMGVKNDDLTALPAYTCLLAANERGRELLAANKKAGGICVITKPADASMLEGGGAKRQNELSAALDAIYTYSLGKSMPSGALVKKKPYIT